mgnify:CR=1 FL=1
MSFRYHDIVINILKDGKGGWEKRGADKAGASLQEEKLGGLQSAYKSTGADGDNDDDEFDAQMEQQRLARRSAKYKEAAAEAGQPAPSSETSADNSSLYPNKTLWQRLVDVLVFGVLPVDAQGDEIKWTKVLRDPEFMRIVVLATIVIGKTLVSDALALYVVAVCAALQSFVNS